MGLELEHNEDVIERCSTCRVRGAKGLHTCPLKTEIHDCYDTCNCCEECEDECHMAI